MQTKVSILKDVFGMLRELIMVLALAAFILVPASVNNILKAAGFTSGSIGGFEWKAEIVASAQTNQDAQDQILKLEGQLGKIQTTLQNLSRQAENPVVREQAKVLTGDIDEARKEAVDTRSSLNRRMAEQKSFVQRVDPDLIRANPRVFKATQP